ncbi:protein-glutamate methylesterase/protein-glutamine glutaminase [Balneatrix alpica]|uniref:Protein-glutamate methylesterase/protein-glutamine glutaminase n=1 Tax=Balneatrix alpica TaxID=75684 RepID=A0ABV5ZHI9_9GAMM|nr:chemotaxis response regulator protein-glutamate methylesterase [Balneatrix alpica]
MAIKVLIVDDSVLVQQILTSILSSDPRLEVVGVAEDPYIARGQIKALNPDVITLDIEMPRMDGLTFLRNLMRLRPMPVVMVSTLTEAGAEATLEALSLGAIDYIEKPKGNLVEGLQVYADVLIEKVVAAAAANIEPLDQPFLSVSETQPATVDVFREQALIAIGASTGGTEAISRVLSGLPTNCPPVVIAQHIPATFSASFAARMDRTHAMQVCLAEHNQAIRAGHVYIAPGGVHLRVEKRRGRLHCCLDDSEPVNRHKPSVDMLFHSVAQSWGREALGVILTGMGADGAKGLLAMKEAGATTIAQDEASSVVWGMPGSSVRLGAVSEQLTLGRIAARILSWAKATNS